MNDGLGEARLSIGQVAQRTGLSVHALRFYEREGLLAGPVARGAGGQRVYGEGDIDWLQVCIVLRGSGMPLPAIRKYTELVREGSGNEWERRELLRQHRDEVLDQIARLHRSLDLINHKVAIYDDFLDQNPGIDPCTMPPHSDARTGLGLGSPDIAG
ncbi:MAG TPA: MerR family transcriptional regulator [Actinocrinis sp.]|nr:MerR family transcriptional regulator [Actinocrinis sp.]